VEAATNLGSPTLWLPIATNVLYAGPVTPTNGWFSYRDTNAPLFIRFYRLWLLP